MGLYIKIQKKYDRNEKLMLSIFEALIDKLNRYFNFNTTSKFILWLEDVDETSLSESEELKVKELENTIEQIVPQFKEKMQRKPHFTISVEGIIQLKAEKSNSEKMIIEVFGTCTQFKDIYGNVWINFYNTSKKWQDYFIGNGPSNDENRTKLYQLINDLKVPDFTIYSIFFAESNIVFDLLNKAYYIYFREYKFYIEFILGMIARLDEQILDYENLLITDEKRYILKLIKDNLRLFDPRELVNIIDKNSIEFSNNYENFLKENYQKRIIYSTTASTEIKEQYMDFKLIRNALTDYIGNFLSTLYETLPKYADIEKTIKKGFSAHNFEPEVKRRYNRF